MSDNFDSVINQEWDDLAIDDGSFILSQNSYKAIIYPRDDTNADIIKSKIDNISYSPKVNSAPKADVDIEPFTELESTPNPYIGGVLDIFVDSEPLFSGEIVSIETNQNDGEFYNLTAEPPGRKLKGDDIDESVSDEIVLDFLASVIDKFNDYDDEMEPLLNSSQESTSNVTLRQDFYIANSDGATVSYSSVGPDASSIEAIYVKVFTNTSIDFTINTANSSYSETLTGLTDGEFGEWHKIEPSGLNSEEYSIDFVMDKDSILYNWISLTEQKISRDVSSFSAEQTLFEEPIQDAPNTSSFSEVISSSSTDPIKVNSDSIEYLQTSWTMEAENFQNSTNAAFADDSIYSNGSYVQVGTTTPQSYEWNFSIDYEVPADDFDVKVRFDEVTNNVADFTWYLNGNQISTYSPTSNDVQWGGGIIEIEGNPPSSNLESGTHTLKVEVNDDTQGTWDLDVVQPYDNGDRYGGFTYNYDNTLNTSSGYLDGPGYYADEFFPNFLEETISQNITKGYLDVSLDTGSPSTIGIAFGDGNFNTDSGVNSVEYNNDYPSSSITGKVSLSSISPNGAKSQTPRYDYDSQTIQSWVLSVDGNNVPIISEEEYSDNRLSVISSVADKSSVFYRMEGSLCKIFERGSRTTSPNLRSESISSSIDIQDVYASCEVIGKDGISSGVIVSSNAPDFINAHKTIRDADITTEDDALRRARSFLNDNGDVQYTGDISTLPTKAPLGEEIDGSLFNHGQNTYIESVRYSKNSTSISCGKEKRVSDSIIRVERDTRSSEARETRI